MSILSITTLNASYGRSTILSDVSFTCNEGELTALLGANGSGKTTLLRSICSLICSTGEIILDGENLRSKSVKETARLISYIPQKCGINISISVLDTVMMAFNAKMKLLEGYNSTHREQAMSALKKMEIDHLADRDFTTLSEGEKQLVIIARTLVENCKFIVCDEPESALDYKNRHKALSVFKEEVKSKKHGALISLHEPSLALEYCDRIVILSEGRCIAQLCPAKDSIEFMEEKLGEIYGPISLINVNGRLLISPKDRSI